MSFLEDNENVVDAKEAARILGVSERSIYGYISSGKLRNYGMGGFTRLLRADVLAFQRTPPGKPRTRNRQWRIPPEGNPLSVTQIQVRQRPGCAEAFEALLETFRDERKHLLNGTVDRYIWRESDDLEQITIMLFWREWGLPSKERRQQEWQAFMDDLAGVLDWSTMEVKHLPVLTHASG